MIRLDFIKPLFVFLIVAGFAAGAASDAFSHAGEKHGTLPISLPDVTAKVNGDEIKKAVILRELKKVAGRSKARGKTLTPGQLKSAAKKLIEDEIGRTLLLQKGKEIGVKVTPQTVDKKLGQIKSKFASDAVFQHKLKDQGMTVEQYREQLKTDLVMDEVIKKEVEPKIKIGAQELKDHYEKNKLKNEEKRRASVILIKIKPNSGAAGEKKARKKIESIRKQTLEGAGFDSLAQKFSQDSLAPKGGDLGFFRKKQMLPAFSERAFQMKVGQVSEIFKTRHGFHLLKVTDIKPAEEIPFDDKEKDKIRKLLLKEKVAGATAAYIDTLKKKADIKTYF